jgi:hypothetical protein
VLPTEGMKICTWAHTALALEACKEVYMLVVFIIVLDRNRKHNLFEIEYDEAIKTLNGSKEGRIQTPRGERKQNAEEKYRIVLIDPM